MEKVACCCRVPKEIKHYGETTIHYTRMWHNGAAAAARKGNNMLSQPLHLNRTPKSPLSLTSSSTTTLLLCEDSPIGEFGYCK